MQMVLIDLNQGFIVSDFRDKSIMDPAYSTVDIEKGSATAIAPVDFWSINAQLSLIQELIEPKQI